MTQPRATDLTAFILSQTTIVAPPLVPEIRLHLATEITPIWEATEASLTQCYVRRERDVLLGQWIEYTGSRWIELANLPVAALYDEVEYARAKLDGLGVRVITSRAKKRPDGRALYAPRSLIDATRRFIEGSRRRHLGRLKVEAVPPQSDVSPVFLSLRKGTGLQARSISKLIGDACRDAGVSWLGHRFRAKYLTEVVERALLELRHRESDVSDQTVLIYAAELAGHSDPKSLQPYLEVVRRALIGEHLDRVVQDHLEVQRLRRKLAALGIEDLIDRISDGRQSDAAALLRKLADRLDQEIRYPDESEVEVT